MPLPCSNAPFWLDVAKAFIGALFGAGLAFAANALNQYRLRRRDNLAAGNLALLILKRQIDDYFNVREAFLQDRAKRLKENPHSPPWAHFKPMIFAFSEGLRFDFRPLAFLFAQGASEVVNRLALAETRYSDLAAIVRVFNETADALQNRLVELGVAPGTAFNIADIEAKLGAALVGKMSSLTSALLTRFEKDEKDYKAAVQTLSEALLMIYKPKEVVKVRPEPGFAQEKWPD